MNGEPPPISNKLKEEDYVDGTMQVLKKSMEHTQPYKAVVMGREFIVFPNVFSPAYFHDTEAFAEHLPVVNGEVMLEIGPGTGAIAISAVYKGAQKVFAIDINPDAVANTQANIDLHAMQDKVQVVQGNLYEPLDSGGAFEGKRFDAIFWNTPFAYVEETSIPTLQMAVQDPFYRSTEAFIKQAKKHLNENGKLLIGFSSTLGRLDLLQKYAEDAGFTLKCIYEVASVETHPVKFEIFEAKSK